MQKRNADETKENILIAAIDEFSTLGFGGARIDNIAEKSGANKRMIYYYFGNKEELFEAVVDRVYQNFRLQEDQIDFDALSPENALKKIVEFTWTYYVEHPELISIVTSVNLHQAKHLVKNKTAKIQHDNHRKRVANLLKRGQKDGVFRKGINVDQLCITLAAIGFYYLNNRHSGSYFFDKEFSSKKMLNERLKFNQQTILNLIKI